MLPPLLIQMSMYVCMHSFMYSFIQHNTIFFSKHYCGSGEGGLRNQTVLGLNSTTYYYFGCAGSLVVVHGLLLAVSGASLVDHRL